MEIINETKGSIIQPLDPTLAHHRMIRNCKEELINNLMDDSVYSISYRCSNSSNYNFDKRSKGCTLFHSQRKVTDGEGEFQKYLSVSHFLWDRVLISKNLGNTIASRYINGIDDPIEIHVEHKFCKKKFCFLVPLVTSLFLVNKHLH